MAENEKGLSRGQKGELSNTIASEGGAERKPPPVAKPPTAQRPRNPFMDEESQARRDRELLR